MLMGKHVCTSGQYKKLLATYIVSVSNNNKGTKMEGDLKVFMSAVMAFIAVLLFLMMNSLLN